MTSDTLRKLLIAGAAVAALSAAACKTASKPEPVPEFRWRNKDRRAPGGLMPTDSEGSK